jgi:hypothetical protein
MPRPTAESQRGDGTHVAGVQAVSSERVVAWTVVPTAPAATPVAATAAKTRRRTMMTATVPAAAAEVPERELMSTEAVALPGHASTRWWREELHSPTV